MGTVESLYRETLMRHSRAPYNQRTLDRPTHAATGINPLCGDEISIQLACQANRIVSVGFTSRACAVCTASASLLTLECEGATIPDARDRCLHVHDLLDGRKSETTNDSLAALAGVSRHPTRLRCALLPWETLTSALENPPRTPA